MSIDNVSKQIWPNTPDDYIFDRDSHDDLIGRGSTAAVYVAKRKDNKKACAIKIIDLEHHTNDDDSKKEIEFMSSCNHENIVDYYSTFVVGRNLWLVMSYCDGGSLLDVLKHFNMKSPHVFKNNKNPFGPFEESQVATILKDVAVGLEYLHKLGHIHRDIKSGNILLSTQGEVKIADFGVSAKLNEYARNAVRTTFVGTPCWMAPEVMDTEVPGYDAKADIWSFGITAIEMVNGHAPYHHMKPMKVILMTLQNPPPTLADVCSEKKFMKDFKSMIEKCLQKNSKDRVSSTTLMKEPFLKKAKGAADVRNMLSKVPRLNDRINEIEAKRAARRKEPEKKVVSGKFTKGTDGKMQFCWDVPEADDDETLNPDSTLQSRVEKLSISSTTKEEKQEEQNINLVLRIRSSENELRDIRFVFQNSIDTADAIVTELVQNNLINGSDQLCTTINMKKVLQGEQSSTFKLPSYTGADVSKTDLIGYAMFSRVSN